MSSRGVGISLVALVLIALPARAQESSVIEPGLNWVRLEGAEDCLSADELADKVELRVGRTLFAGRADPDNTCDHRQSEIPHRHA